MSKTCPVGFDAWTRAMHALCRTAGTAPDDWHSITQKECRMQKATLRPRRGDWSFTKDVCAKASSLSRLVPRT